VGYPQRPLSAPYSRYICSPPRALARRAPRKTRPFLDGRAYVRGRVPAPDADHAPRHQAGQHHARPGGPRAPDRPQRLHPLLEHAHAHVHRRQHGIHGAGDARRAPVRVDPLGHKTRRLHVVCRLVEPRRDRVRAPARLSPVRGEEQRRHEGRYPQRPHQVAARARPRFGRHLPRSQELRAGGKRAFCSCFVLPPTSFFQLLTRDPAQRLGCRPEGQGLEDIHAHPWFAGIDWARLDTKQLPPAFAPDKNQPNFDVGYELDEFLLLEQPLHHKKRKNVDPEALTPEYRQLEEEFGVYDARTSQRMAHVVPEPAGGRASHSPSPSRADGGTLRLAPRPSGASSRSGGSSDRAPSRAAADDASSATAVSTDRRSASPTGSHLTRAMREDYSRAGTPVTVPVDPHLHMRPAPLPPARRSGSSRPSR
jgi:hypothetical protein